MHTSLKHGQGFRTCSSIAHFTEAVQILALYSRELWLPEGVPRDLS